MSISSQPKIRAATLSVVSNALLTTAKLIVAYLTGSVSVLSEGMHSLIDLLAAGIALYAVRVAAQPADRGHPYGHGKIENVSGTLEAILIFVAAGIIFNEALHRMRRPVPLDMIGLGMAVMCTSALANTLVAFHLQKVARQTDSAALAADAAHLRTDTYTSLGGMMGLAAVSATGLYILDPIIACCIAMVILWEAWVVLRRSSRDLLDAALPEAEISVIGSVLDAYRDRFQDWHALRTRKAGSERKVDLHLTLCRDEHVDVSHALCDEIEREIQARISGMDIMIHVESCTKPEDACHKEPCIAVSHPEHLVRTIVARRVGSTEGLEVKDIRVYRGGKEPHIDICLVFPEGMSVAEAHKTCDEIEGEITAALPRFRVVIHIEPSIGHHGLCPAQ